MLRLGMMFCGASSFKDVDKEAVVAGAGGKPPAAAAKAKAKARKVGGGKTKGKKANNPYASRGLDKFSTVLSELESRRKWILRGVGPDVDAGHLMVRFVKSEAKGWVPIVVKLPSEEERAADDDTNKRQCKPSKLTSTPTEPASPKEDAANNHVAPAVKSTAAPAAKKNNKPGGGERWSWSWGRMVRPCYYWPLALVLLLLSLVVFGRAFAICCTSIWWYLLPMLSGYESQGAAKTRVSDKVAAVAPAPTPPPSHMHGKKSSTGAAHKVVSPRSHAHRKKG